jgi:hypothetical protein
VRVTREFNRKIGLNYQWSWYLDNVVGIVSRLLAGRNGVRITAGGKKLYSQACRLSLGLVHPPTQMVPWVLFPKAKLPGREVDHQPPSGAEVKNEWIFTS